MATKINPLLLLQQQQQQEPPSSANQNSNQASPTDAPPKQVAVAMDRLGQAARLIAEVRLGADRLLELLFIAAQPHQCHKPLQLFVKEDAAMRQHIQDLRSVGRQLEESWVLNDSLRSRSNSWGLHMPLVCPDGAIVAYAWKRQLAGQAGASAVDRTKLALKAFTDQKKRFFPYLGDDLDDQSTESVSKKHRSCQVLSDILTRFEKEMPNCTVSTYERLDWLKRASSLPALANENLIETSKDHTFQTLNKLRTGSQGPVTSDKISVIELLFPSVFRAIVSLHPAGSVEPDAVAFFSPDEVGSYIHARGFSVHHVFRHITEHAATALQHFHGIRTETTLYVVLHWACTYNTLFTKVCSKCGKLLAMDRKLSLLVPPVRRPYRNFCPPEVPTVQPIHSTRDQDSDVLGAYHIGCFSEDV